MQRLVLVLIIISLMSVTADSVVSAVTEPATESFSITAIRFWVGLNISSKRADKQICRLIKYRKSAN